MTTTTVERIRTLAHRVTAAFADWDSRPPVLDANDRPIPEAVPAEVWEAFDAWLAEYDPLVFPKVAKDMEDVRAEYAQFNAMGSAVPNNNFWAAYRRAVDACMQPMPRFVPHPSVAELTAQKVSDPQICTMWELFDAQGNRDFNLLARERAEPGSVINQAKLDGMRLKAMQEQGWAPKDIDVPKAAAAKAREPGIEELLSEGANVRQVATLMERRYMKDYDDYVSRVERWEAVVLEVADLMGLDAPRNAAGQVMQARKDFIGQVTGTDVESTRLEGGHAGGSMEVQLEPEEVVDPSIPSRARETQVMELHELGNDLGAIALETGLTEGKVLAIIGKYTTPAESEADAAYSTESSDHPDLGG